MVYKLLHELTRIGFTIFSMGIYAIKYRKFYREFNMHVSIRKGFKDHKPLVATGSDQYMTIFRRLLDSYNKAKIEQKNIDEVYQPSYLWQHILDCRFGDLIASIHNNNTIKLQVLLENFHREKFTLGSGGGSDDYYAIKENPLYRYQFLNTWYKYFNIYKEIAGDHYRLTYPMLGNPAGLYYDGQVIPLEAIRYHYYATEILSLLLNVKNPIICEIGGGLGGQAYKVMSNFESDSTYILLDIPEMLIVSSYFLMAALPEKKFLLYGEDSFDSGKVDQYDIILMPNFILPQLGDMTVDLFFNSCSFSEMDRITVEKYLREIERICRRYFMHINHTAKFEWCVDGKKYVNMPSTEIIPNQERYKKIYQHRRLFRRPEDEKFYSNTKSQHFVFLYERIHDFPII